MTSLDARDEPRPVVLWRVADAAGCAGRLAALGMRVVLAAPAGAPSSDRWLVGLGPAVLALEDAAGAAPLLAVASRPPAVDPVRGAGGTPETPPPDQPGARLVAIGWATVDLERAARSGHPIAAGPCAGSSAIGTALRAPSPLPDDAALGARAAVLAGAVPAAVVLLEPSREGRLAASLARFGEGPCVVYVRIEGAGRPSSALEPASDGPFGRQRLLAGGPPWGPHVVVVLDVVAPAPPLGREPLPSEP